MAKNTVVCTDHQSEAKIKSPFFKGFRTLNNSNSGIYILSYQEHKIDLGFATEKSANLRLKIQESDTRSACSLSGYNLWCYLLDAENEAGTRYFCASIVLNVPRWVACNEYQNGYPLRQHGQKYCCLH